MSANPLVRLSGNKLITTSLDISDHFQRPHKDILRAIENLECSQDFSRRNFAPISYNDGYNRKQPAFEITKDGFMFLCMGFTGTQAALWKERYITEFNRMESALNSDIPALIRSLQAERDRLQQALLGSHPVWQQAWQFRAMGLTDRQVAKLMDLSIDRVRKMFAKIREAGLNLPAPKHTPSMQITKKAESAGV